MAEIINLNCITTLDIPPDRILESAQGKLETALIVGENMEGKFYFASSVAHYGEMLLMLEEARQYVMEHYRNQK
ncbi:MAG TPA: hypothetical protein VJ742_08535 [Nitrososphaera sp.]|nr:hypothetical protein [Nitrososphaera sp.]